MDRRIGKKDGKKGGRKYKRKEGNQNGKRKREGKGRNKENKAEREGGGRHTNRQLTKIYLEKNVLREKQATRFTMSSNSFLEKSHRIIVCELDSF